MNRLKYASCAFHIRNCTPKVNSAPDVCVHIRLIVLMYLNVRFLKLLQMNKTWWFNTAAGHRLNYSTPVTLTKMLSFLSPHCLFNSPGSAVPPISDKEKMLSALTFQEPNSTVRSFLMLLHFYWSVCLFHPRFAQSLSLSFCIALPSRGKCMSDGGGTGSLNWTMATLCHSEANGISPSCLMS